MTLPKPAFYFPIERPIYEVSAGLKPLGFDFGNGDADRKIFQIDENFQTYRHNKLECRAERLTKYFTQFELTLQQQKILSQFIIKRLCLEHPGLFSIDCNQTLSILKCSITGDLIQFDQNYVLVDFKSGMPINPQPSHILDALALQIPEDFALLCRREDKTDYLSVLHLCSASHWAAEDKIGKSFTNVHAPIPHIEKISVAAKNMVEAMIHKGPFVRFVWSFVTDTRMNHHPIAPPGQDQNYWKGRSFNADLDIPFYLRIERQVVYGLPQIEASYFGIGITFVDGVTVKNNELMRAHLLGALYSMSPESRIYKGVDTCFSELTNWLKY